MTDPETLAALESLRQTHLVVEDCWYSCPVAKDSRGRSECCNDNLTENPRCNCGADAHNAKLDEIIARVRVSPERAAPPLETLDGIISDIERVFDAKMWRDRNGELTWRGETPDGNEIETEPPRVLLASALSALRTLRGGAAPAGEAT